MASSTKRVSAPEAPARLRADADRSDAGRQLVEVIPSIDVQGGRSRVVHWPGASAGTGTPTDRPERIAERVVEQGARVVQLVDFDGARRGTPVSLEIVGAVASRVAVPLQLAGGLEHPDHIRLAFAAGATRVVLTMAVVDDPSTLAACLEVAGDWLAVGLDPRPDRIAAFPWHRSAAPSLDALVGELVAAGVHRLVLAHGSGAPDTELLAGLVRRHDAEILVAGGVGDIDGVRELRDAGVSGVILGEAVLSGRIDLAEALAAAA